jgi:hypothetical protein
MNAPLLSISGNENEVIAGLKAWISNLPLRTTTGTHSVCPVAMSARPIVWTKLPAVEPGMGDEVDLDEPRRRIVPVAKGVNRNRAPLQPARRRRPPRATSHTSANSRSIVAGLIGAADRASRPRSRPTVPLRRQRPRHARRLQPRRIRPRGPGGDAERASDLRHRQPAFPQPQHFPDLAYRHPHARRRSLPCAKGATLSADEA